MDAISAADVKQLGFVADSVKAAFELPAMQYKDAVAWSEAEKKKGKPGLLGRLGDRDWSLHPRTSTVSWELRLKWDDNGMRLR